MKKINDILLGKVIEEASVSPRKRKNYNFHENLSDTLQRLLNAMEPLSYIQPHKHEDPDKREIFFSLKGKIAVIEFDEKGNITDHILLDPLNGNYGTEISERTFHTIISLEPGTVAYEFKDGPYAPLTDKDFAHWAPKEGDPGVHEYLLGLLDKIGIKEVKRVA
ncbi:MAG: WbuC family cupin fold metalloprotein [Bacteroidota bacterium]